MENVLTTLFKEYFGSDALTIEPLPASGSARKYFRISNHSYKCIGTYNADISENNQFIAFSEYFHDKGIAVPEIYIKNKSGTYYLQQELGNTMLLDYLCEHRTGKNLDTEAMQMYKYALDELQRMQLSANDLDYSKAIPRPKFDQRCIMWDLNYFKYCFLKLLPISINEDLLENDFEKLTANITSQNSENFMFRDFQSRNIMVVENGVYFIDYQGGRKGPLAYDVASLLYDAIAEIPDNQRMELFEYYADKLRTINTKAEKEFRDGFYHVVLIRLLQAMGAFGLRGLYEKKEHFILSIKPGLTNIIALFDNKLPKASYPEIEKLCRAALRLY